MTFPGELGRFNLYPARGVSSHHFTVLVFKDRGAMHRAYRILNPTNDTDQNFGAVVLPQERRDLVNGKWQPVDQWLGYALFAQTQLDVETQCHEAVHMTITFLDRIKQKPKQLPHGMPCASRNETLCYFSGWIASRLNHHFYKRGLYR